MPCPADCANPFGGSQIVPIFAAAGRADFVNLDAIVYILLAG